MTATGGNRALSRKTFGPGTLQIVLAGPRPAASAVIPTITVSSSLATGGAFARYPFPSIVIDADAGGQSCTATASLGSIRPVTTRPRATTSTSSSTTSTTAAPPTTTNPWCRLRAQLPPWLQGLVGRPLGITC